MESRWVDANAHDSKPGEPVHRGAELGLGGARPIAGPWQGLLLTASVQAPG